MTDHHAHIDLAVAWSWEQDADFVRLLEDRASAAGLRTLQIHSDNLARVTEELEAGKMSVSVLLDRASDEDEAFLGLARYVLQRYRGGAGQFPRPINPLDLQMRAADKATMHLEFISSGIHVPYTIIISPFNETREVELSLSELERLGRPFIIKPANTTGGGVGVVLGAETLKQVIEARQLHRSDKYLLQETIIPVEWDGRRAWFRSFYVCGEVLTCWWDDETHRYQMVTEKDASSYGLHVLEATTRRIQSVCQLDFFSTELAFTSADRIVSVDYVNELCDMRLQSKAPDGVPDPIVSRICSRIVDWIRARLSEPEPSG